MEKRNPRIFIAGGGGIGRATGLLLRELGSLDPHIIIGDRFLESARSAAMWISEEAVEKGKITCLQMPEKDSDAQLDEVLAQADLLLDCLPGGQAPRMAKLCLQHGLHYANLTEYVAETDEIMSLAQNADTGFILQTGLAPGFVGVLANGLFQRFCAKHEVESVQEVLMRVGALTRNAAPPHFYGFTWSPVGVATEYVKPAIVVREGLKTTRPSLSERSIRIIRHQTFEEDLTSGGAADLPDALAGKVQSLDYKTLRYPGHYQWVDQLLAGFGAVSDPSVPLEAAMLEQVPIHEDDMVVIFASVSGKDPKGRLQTLESDYFLYPVEMGGKKLRAIQATTAAPLAQCAAMLLSGKYQGVVLQSQIDPDAFLQGEFIQAVYGEGSK